MTDQLIEQLAAVLAEPIAQRVVELLAADPTRVSDWESPWLDATAAAEYLRTTRNALYKLTDLPRHRVSENRYLWHRDELDAYLEERREGPPPAFQPRATVSEIRQRGGLAG